MTLRQLIQEIIRINEFEALANKITDIHPEWDDARDKQVLKTYRRVSHEIEDLPGCDELEGHTIVIDEVENILSDVNEKWIDVHLVDDEGDKWSIDMTDWNGLVDLPIKDNVCRSLSDRLAHILYEVTFWGTTRKSVLHEAEMLQKTRTNEDNLIEVSIDEFRAEIDKLK
jgi:DNA-directed RNA polymerase subunit F